MENLIKAYKRHLAADRTSCGKATANQFRLFLHAASYWLVWALQATLPKRSPWRTAQFDTVRLRLIKIATRVDELKKRVRVRLPTACPDQPILRFCVERLTRLRLLTGAAGRRARSQPCVVNPKPSKRPRPAAAAGDAKLRPKVENLNTTLQSC